MHIKRFTRVFQHVPDPMRPGRSVPTPRLVDAKANGLSVDGHNYEPDAHGWFDVPQELGEHLCKFRDNGSGFFTPGEVADAVNLGRMDGMDEPAPVAEKPQRRRAAADA